MSNITRHESKSQRMLREVSSSHGISFGTDVPYRFAPVGFSRIGFADIPVAGCRVYTKDIEPVVPLVRQHIMRVCHEHGLDVGALEMSVTVGIETRKRKVKDENKSSKSYGKDKILSAWRCHLEITRPDVVKSYQDQLMRVYL